MFSEEEQAKIERINSLKKNPSAMSATGGQSSGTTDRVKKDAKTKLDTIASKVHGNSKRKAGAGDSLD